MSVTEHAIRPGADAAPQPPAPTPKGRQVDPRGARRSRGAAHRPAAPARSADRASASDPGQVRPSLRRASRGARRRDEAGADRGLRGRDLLRAFRRREGRRRRRRRRSRCASAIHCPARWRAPSTLLKDLPGTLGKDVRVVRAPCMGACDHAPVCAVGHVQVIKRERSVGRRSSRIRTRMRTRIKPGTDFAAYHGGRRLRAARRLPRRQAHARRPDQDRQRCRPARPWRRRLPDRAQMVAGARRAGPAADGGQRRRGRARHLQGPLLSRPRSAPLHRRHADRRLGGRGRRASISISATNIPSCG